MLNNRFINANIKSEKMILEEGSKINSNPQRNFLKGTSNEGKLVSMRSKENSNTAHHTEENKTYEKHTLLRRFQHMGI